MAWREGDLWVATCLDYSLAAQGDSLPEAKLKLHAQIADYVREAVTIDAAHADALLTRKAPLWDLMLYAFWRTVNNRPRLRRSAGKLIRHLKVAIENKLAYIEPLPIPLQPA